MRSISQKADYCRIWILNNNNNNTLASFQFIQVKWRKWFLKINGYVDWQIYTSNVYYPTRFSSKTLSLCVCCKSYRRETRPSSSGSWRSAWWWRPCPIVRWWPRAKAGAWQARKTLHFLSLFSFSPHSWTFPSFLTRRSTASHNKSPPQTLSFSAAQYARKYEGCSFLLFSDSSHPEHVCFVWLSFFLTLHYKVTKKVQKD